MDDFYADLFDVSMFFFTVIGRLKLVNKFFFLLIKIVIDIKPTAVRSEAESENQSCIIKIPLDSRLVWNGSGRFGVIR